MSCDDKNPCTGDSCAAATGCAHKHLTTACEDGDKCTLSDTCVGGKCGSGKAKVCDDGSVCTDDGCNKATGDCEFPANAATCEDGSKCTLGDACKDGKCVAGAAKSCDDNNGCTDDTCDANTGVCSSANNTAGCDDGDKCTGAGGGANADKCAGGKCAGGAKKVCDDKNGCTDDSCDAKTGTCTFAPNKVACDDGDKCTGNDACANGKCAGEAKAACDDGHACTTDTCDPKTGCSYKPAPDGTLCPTGVCGGGNCIAAAPALGDYFTCAIKKGGVRCFGQGSSYQLGHGKAVKYGAVDVPGLKDIVQLVAGRYHTCALAKTGEVKCWGREQYGSMALGVYSVKLPTASPSVGKVTGISAGAYNTCAWHGGTAWCWGAGSYGQIGNGKTESTNKLPAAINLKEKVQQVAIGGQHACALAKGGGVWCWGYNYYNAAASISDKTVNNPLQVKAITDAVQVAAGNRHSCALLKDGTVKCWGYNSSYQAAGKYVSGGSRVKNPVTVAGVTGARRIALGGNTSCALLKTGTIRCWGSNHGGMLGTGSISPTSSKPVDVKGITGATALAVGSTHACAFVGEKLMCWGRSREGQGGTPIGDGPYKNKVLTAATSVSAGYTHACALDHKGAPSCWGQGTYGQLGDGHKLMRGAPTKVDTTTKFTAISAGYYHTCGIDSGGQAHCWGRSNYGALGNGKTYGYVTKPTPVLGLKSVTAISAGRECGCAVADKKASCWGRNSQGQVGDGSKTTRSKAVPVKGLGDVVDIDGDYYHACAAAADGKVWCWGYNYKGQLGNGSTTSSPDPVQAKGITAAVAVTTGYYASCALTGAGKFYCWGDNSYRQLDGNAKSTYTPIKEPIEMKGFAEPIIGVSGSRYHLCAVSKNGTLACLGSPGYGVFLEPPPWTSSKTPKVSKLKAVAQMSAGYQFSCAVTSDKALWCGGTSSSGQLGIGDPWTTTPLPAAAY